MLALATECVHPRTKQPYVKSYGGGRDNSPEGLQVVDQPLPVQYRDIGLTSAVQGAFTHGFVSEFQNEEDRKYYLEQDPAHLAFVASLTDIMQNVRVVDFVPGKF